MAVLTNSALHLYLSSRGNNEVNLQDESEAVAEEEMKILVPRDVGFGPPPLRSSSRDTLGVGFEGWLFFIGKRAIDKLLRLEDEPDSLSSVPAAYDG